MVAGDALIGVVVALLVMSFPAYKTFYEDHGGMWDSLTGSFGPWLALILFFGLMLVLTRMAFGKKK